MNAGKPFPVVSRIVALLLLGWLASLRHNPLVRLEAWLGLSPSPLEKLFGIKGLFSGMTEGMYRLSHGDVRGSIEINALTPVMALLVVGCIVFGYRPRVRTRRSEMAFFGFVLISTLLVNFVN
jgi:hypothetical protein